MSEVVLLGLPPSSYVRSARMICAAKGVSYDLQPVNFRSDAYREIHPFGRMPALQHGHVTLYETLAIGTYIDEAFDGPPLQPSDPLGRARMMQWISVLNDYVVTTMVGACISERFIKPMRGQDPDEAKIAAAVPEMAQQLDVLEAGLDGAYLCGDVVTLADLFAAPVLHYLEATPEGEMLLAERRQVVAWLERMAATPDFAEINQIGP